MGEGRGNESVVCNSAAVLCNRGCLARDGGGGGVSERVSERASERASKRWYDREMLEGINRQYILRERCNVSKLFCLVSSRESQRGRLFFIFWGGRLVVIKGEGDGKLLYFALTAVLDATGLCDRAVR